jgi:hypothetical protein
MLMVGLAICLFGCDQSPKATAPAPVAAAPAAACNCQHLAQTAPAPIVEAPRSHRHNHHRWHRMTYEASGQESASSVSSYPDSHEAEYAGESHGGDAGGPAAYPPPPPPVASSEVWVDGYGRSHYAGGGTAVEADSNPAVLSAEDAHRRSDPWRGYDARCPNAVD